MLTIGSNSRLEPMTGQSSSGPFGCAGVALPVSSRHFGLTSACTRSGTASLRICCLSDIDPELSIISKRSILSTELCVSLSTIVEVVRGSTGSIGRSRHAGIAAKPASTSMVPAERSRVRDTVFSLVVIVISWVWTLSRLAPERQSGQRAERQPFKGTDSYKAKWMPKPIPINQSTSRPQNS